MPDTPSSKYAIQRPADADHIHDWPSIMRTTIDTLDQLIVAFSVANPRPAAGKSGRLHRHPTTGVISYDDGAAWHEMTTQPHASRHSELGDDPLYGQMPIAGQIAYCGSVLPPGTVWAWADGSLIDKTTYAEFFARVGHAYNGGVDPGSNKVKLPDKRGRVPVGADSYGAGAAGRIVTSNHARGQNGGAERIALATAELAAHAHTINSSGQSTIFPAHLGAGAGFVAGEMAGTPGGFKTPAANPGGPNWFVPTIALAHAHTMANAGSGTSHQNLQPYETDVYIVRIA